MNEEFKKTPDFVLDKSKEKKLRPEKVVAAVNKLETEIALLSNEALGQKTTEFRLRLAQAVLGAKEGRVMEAQQEILNQLLPEVFAVVRESGKRFLGLRHRDVQISTGLALHQGQVVEMRTGEGKTLAATLAVYLNSLVLNPAWVERARQEWGEDASQWQFGTLDGTPVGKGVHVVTTNDYLSRRDAKNMAYLYQSLGLTSGVLQNSARDSNQEAAFLVDLDKTAELESLDKLEPVARKTAYQADITYGTQSEFGFDYLRDHMRFSSEEQVQRGHYFAVVDEADDVLIDQASTPLIISGPSQKDVGLYQQVGAAVKKLKEGTDFTVNEAQRQVNLTLKGERRLSKELGIPFSTDYLPEHVFPRARVIQGYVEQALRAEHIFTKGQDYVVLSDPQSGVERIFIVDAATGHLMPGRTWSDGIHQAIEAKEGLEISGENATYASIPIQSYFRMYQKLSGMSGTVLESESEFKNVYGMDAAFIPTHIQYLASTSNLLKQTQINEEGVEEIFYVDPDNPDEILFWERTDYPDVICFDEADQAQALLAEVDHYHQLGRPILIGTTSVEQSEALSKLLGDKGVDHQVLNAKLHAQESQVIANAGRLGAVTIATNMAGRGVDIKLGGELPHEVMVKINQLLRHLGIENVQDLNKAERVELLQTLKPKQIVGFEAEVSFFLDQFQAEQKVNQLGGLHVIGTQRHRSARVDHQLQGRAARQGDPGSSRFILSIDNDLTQAMSESNSQLKEFLAQDFTTTDWGEKELQLAMQLLEQAQDRAEEDDSLARQQLLEYEQVQTLHRERVYEQIQTTLSKENLVPDLMEIMANEIDFQLEKITMHRGQPRVILQWLESLQPTLEIKEGIIPSLGMSLIRQELAVYAEDKSAFATQALNLKEQFILEKQASVERSLNSLVNLVDTANELSIGDLLKAINDELPIKISLSIEDLIGLEKQNFANKLKQAIEAIFANMIETELGMGESRQEKAETLLSDSTSQETLSPDQQLELIKPIFLTDKNIAELDADYLQVLAQKVVKSEDKSTLSKLRQIFVTESSIQEKKQLLRELANTHLTHSWQLIEQQFSNSIELNNYLRQLITRSFNLGWMNYLTQAEKLRIGTSLEAYAQQEPVLVYKNQAADLFKRMMTQVRGEVMRQLFTNLSI